MTTYDWDEDADQLRPPPWWAGCGCLVLILLFVLGAGYALGTLWLLRGDRP